MSGTWPRWVLRHLGANEEKVSERGSETISDRVFGTRSLSALIVPMTVGNAAHADPVEGSGAPLYRAVFVKH